MHTLLPALTLGFVLIVILLPLTRHYRQTGELAVVIRPTSTPAENLVRVWTSALLALVLLWVGATETLAADTHSLRPPSPLVHLAGVALAVASLLLVAIAQYQMGHSWRIGIDDRETDLCTSGLFRIIRHPIYTGILGLLSAITMITPSPWSLSIMMLGFLLVGLQARLEEAHMLDQHGEAFLLWAARTGRFLPVIGRIRAK